MLLFQKFSLEEGLDIMCYQSNEVVAFGQVHSIDPMALCHFQHYGDKRCVVIVTNVICLEIHLKYHQGDFDTLGDFDMQVQ